MYRLFHLDEREAIWHSIKQECSWFMGNLGFMKSKPLICRAFAENRRKSLYPSPLFYGFPRPQLYPHGKKRCSAPGAPAQQAEADLARIKAEKLPIPAGVQTALAEHYQALLHTNDFYQYLTLFKELGQKQTQQQSCGRKINAMDTYFYQMVERVLREELAVAFGESQQEASKRLLEVLR